MNPRELTAAILRRDDLSARQMVKDAKRLGFSWANAPAPDFSSRGARAVYAGIVELMADRNGQVPPAWTCDVPASPAPLFLVHATKKSKGLRRDSLSGTPDPLKKRNVFALPDYLDVL